jgi:bacillithiol biosynthesis cysteine-adding enzyme BshC
MSTSAAAACRLPLSSYPGISRFALDLVSGGGSAARFVPRKDLDALSPSSRTVDASLADALETSNAGWGNDVSAALQRWKDAPSVTIVAGQQVGFAGGPLYTLAKIASMLNLKRRLAARGAPVTLFFWMATEDHDFSEVAAVVLSDGAGRTTELRSSERRGRRAVGPQAIPDDLQQAFVAATGKTFPWLEAGISFRDSFAMLLSEVLRGEEVILVDALLPELRRSGERILSKLAGDLPAVEAAIGRRSAELEASGYKAQVETAPDGHYALLFQLNAKIERLPIRREERGFLVGSKDVDADTLATMIRDLPERISTAALARPLLQDFVLSPEVFIGGPAEVTYYAQLGEVYPLLGIEPPHVALRGHALVAPERTLHVLEQYGIAPEELTLSPDAIIARHEPARVEEVARRVEEATQNVARELETIRRLAAGDVNVAKSLNRTAGKIEYHFGRASDRAVRAVARADGERYAAVSRLCRTLFPNGAPQDRTVAWFSWWTLYGRELIDRLTSGAPPDQASFDIIGL